MGLPRIVSREQWLAARRELLAREIALTRTRDALTADRRRLPMVAVEKDYTFEGPAGRISLGALFEECRQLIIVHFMFDPSWDDGCPSCAAAADELPPRLAARLRERDTAFAMVSLAPFEKLARYQAQAGWAFPWYSSFGGDFNYDYHATLDQAHVPVMWNYEAKEDILAAGSGDDLLDTDQPVEVPAISCFLRDGDRIFHTYSAYGRSVEEVGSVRSFLDLTALGS